MARPSKHDGTLYRRNGSGFWWMRYRDRNGARRQESTRTEDWLQAQKKLRERLQARDENTLDLLRKGEQLTFSAWADFFLENYSKPPMRAEKTHAANLTALKHLMPAFGKSKLTEITADQVEMYLRLRLRQRKRVKTALGFVEYGLLKPATVHQEFRVLRRILSVAVRKRMCGANAATAAEFPTTLKGLFRPHYMSWSEQQKIEAGSPQYLCNLIRIITETGLRVYKELACIRKEQVDLENRMVFIPDSKTVNGIAEVPLTDVAAEAFQSQILLSGPGPWLFPSDLNPRGYQQSFRKVWATTLRKAGVAYFRLYDLRSTYASRLSSGGVADEWVTQLLRQGDSKVFKKYSQMKLQMKREALEKLDRMACERSGFATVRAS